MRNHRVLLALIVLFTTCLTVFAQRQVREMDFGWKFILGEQPGAEQTGFPDENWRGLDVPHDWSIEGDFSKDSPHGSNLAHLPAGIGWYRKSFVLTGPDLGRTVWIEFDGVYMNSDVWINGRHLGHHPNGYTGFHYVLNPHLREGANTIAVRVDNSRQPNSRWYAGSGIYRHVRLVLADSLHIARNGVTVTTPGIREEYAEIAARVVVENRGPGKRQGALTIAVIDPQGREVASCESAFALDANSTQEIAQQVKVPAPALWSVESPDLYTLKTTLADHGKVVDGTATSFGIRQIEFLADRGFLLNGRPVKMKGVCLHHDGGAVGVAVPEAVWIRRLKLLKEMGCNAIRASHNPVAPEFLDLCDRMGFLVMNEAFDEWEIGRVKYGYNQHFAEWSGVDLTEMIRRDRNHPSVVIWSVGNEIPDQGTPRGLESLKRLMAICRTEDPTRPVTVACIFKDDGEHLSPVQFLESLDIVGYNYVDRFWPRRELLYTVDKLLHPGWKMIGSENSAIYSVRGEYPVGKDPDRFVPNYHTAMIDIEYLWKYVLTHDFVMGDFMWTGIDYLGEAKWPNLGPPCGVIDRCGFPKDSFYFYRSIWKSEPVLHLFPHWNWPGREGQVLPVVCYTNCEEVELFVNGESCGTQLLEFPRKGKTMVMNWSTYETRKHATTSDLHLTWYVPYQPGVVKAVGRRNGEVVSTTEIRTSGPPAVIRLSADKPSLDSAARDVAHLKVEVVDQAGLVVPTANDRVVFRVEGQGKLIGVDNGNPQDHDSFKLDSRRAFNGLCLALVQTTGSAGTIKVTASAERLGSASLEIEAKPGPAMSENAAR